MDKKQIINIDQDYVNLSNKLKALNKDKSFDFYQEMVLDKLKESYEAYWFWANMLLDRDTIE